jgi:hypothetical protein
MTTRRLSPWAILAMLLSIGLCPFVTIAAIPAGMMALRDVRLHERRGRRLAIVAIVIGCVVTPVTSYGAWWWNGHVREPLMAGPIDLLAAGQRGDVSVFLDGLAGGDTQAQRKAAAAFLTRLTAVVGVVESMQPADMVDADQDPEPESGEGWTVRVPYDAMFQHGAARITARFLLSTPTRGWVTRFDMINIELPHQEQLTWPPSEEDTP